MARNNAAGSPAAPSTDDVEDNGTDLETALDNELTSTLEDALNVDDDELDEDLDEDDLDEDDLDDDDEDLDDDEDDDVDDEGSAGAETADGAAAAPAAAAPAKDGEAAAGAPATGAATAAATAAATDTKNVTAKPAEGAPKWEPFSVNVDKQAVPIEEASIQRANGVVYIGMKEEAFNRFQQRISRGVVGERMWRQLQDGLKELDVQRSTPARETDAEIEARLTYEALRPHLKDFLDDRDVELLETKIGLAKANAEKEYNTKQSEHVAKAKETPWEEQQETTLKETVRGIAAADPELAALTPDEIDDVIQKELLPVRNALITRDKDGLYGNTQYMFDRLKARASNRKTGAAANAAAAAPSTTPANAGNSSTTATSAADKRADRFNRGVDAAPRTTSFAAQRGKNRPANGDTRNTGRRGRRRLTPAQQRERAEDNYRKKEREFLKSPGLDFGS